MLTLLTADPRPPNGPAVLHLVNTLDGGGTERTLLALLQQLDRNGVRHVLVTLRRAGSLVAELPEHVACHALDLTGRSRLAALRVAEVARRCGASLIHARNTGCWSDALAAGVLARVPVALGFHGLEAATAGPQATSPARMKLRVAWPSEALPGSEAAGGCPPAPRRAPNPKTRQCRDTSISLSFRQRVIARTAARLGARFTTVGQAGREQLQTEAGIPAARIACLPNGVRLERFAQLTDETRRQSRRALGVDDAACVVGTVGSLTPVKGHLHLVRAFAVAAGRRGDLHLLVVGDGSLRTQLAQEVADHRLSGRVSFTGWREDVPALLAAMDLYVCSSGFEGTSNALLEAMAAAVATVTTPVGDHPRIVRHGIDGLVAPSGGVEDLAEAIERLAADPVRRVAMGRAARARVVQFGFERTLAAHLAFYEPFLRSSRRAAPVRVRSGAPRSPTAVR